MSNSRWLLSAIAALQLAACAQPQPPNIIVILADDQRFDALGIASHPVLETPNIDALAERGMYFENAFVTSAICTPSRTSILTGQYERKHGVTFGSRSALSDAAFERTYPMVLRQHGYVAAYIGKNHTPIGLTESGFGYDSGVIESGFDYWYGNHGHMGFYPKERHPIYASATPDTQVEIIRDAALNFIRSDKEISQGNPALRVRPSGKPFVMLINFNVPHSSGVTSMEQRTEDPDRYRSLYRNEEELFPIPETYVAYDEIEILRIPKRIYANEYIESYSYAKKPDTLVEHSLREAQTITGIDVVVGDIVDALVDEGIDGNTIIVYLSDHGVLHGEHGLGGKTLLYEEAVRIPLVIYDPRIRRGAEESRSGNLALNIDIYPTLLDLAGVPLPDGVQGRSLAPLLRGREVAWREDFFMENLFMGQGYPRIEGVRSENYKYIRYFDPELNRPHALALKASIEGEQPVYEELFDLRMDPMERVNLAGDPGATDVLERMRARNRELLIEAIGNSGPPDTYLQQAAADSVPRR
jgi:arylsulfatase A-like enzyme